jgi:enoyl-CoA hydratase
VGEILLERDGPIVWMRMNRPEAHNAFSTDMIALMADQVRRLAGDREVRVAILRQQSIVLYRARRKGTRTR